MLSLADKSSEAAASSTQLTEPDSRLHLCNSYTQTDQEPSSTPCLSLSDLMHEVPRLLELVPKDSLAALIATNRAHRSLIHDFATRITLPYESPVDQLLTGGWPSLHCTALHCSLLLLKRLQLSLRL